MSKVITNGIYRHILSGFELPVNVVGKLEFANADEMSEWRGFVYKGFPYSLGEFGRINNRSSDPHSLKPPEGHPWASWDGFEMGSVSPLLVRFSDDHETILVARTKGGY